MTERQTFIIRNDTIRANAINAIRAAQIDDVVKIGPPNRSPDQNSYFHALCQDLADSQLKWAGKRRTLDEWKALAVSGHSVATGEGGEVVPGLEGEFVAIRESTSRMGVARASSLIEYVKAYCVTNGVELKATRAGGFE